MLMIADLKQGEHFVFGERSMATLEHPGAAYSVWMTDGGSQYYAVVLKGKFIVSARAARRVSHGLTWIWNNPWQGWEEERGRFQHSLSDITKWWVIIWLSSNTTHKVSTLPDEYDQNDYVSNEQKEEYEAV